MNKTVKSISIAILSIITIALSYWMYQLHLQEDFWGVIPLFTMLSAWGAIVLLREKSWTKSEKRYRWLGLSTLSGVLLFLGFPIMPFTPLLFIAFVPLLIVEKEIATEREEASKWTVFRFSYHTFVLWNILSTYWVGNSAFVAGAFAVLVNSALMGLPLIAFHQVRKRLNEKMALLGFLAFWMTFEKLHQYWELSWTWLTLGNAFAQYPSWVQWYEYTGVFGGSLWILLANVLAFKIWENYQSTQKWDIFSFVRWVSLLLLPILVSLIWYYNYEETGTPKEIVITQSNYDPHYEKFTIPATQQLAKYFELARKELSENTDYLLLPETAFGNIRTNDFLGDNRILRQFKSFMKDYPNLKTVMGVSAHRVYDADEAHPPTIRKLQRKNSIFFYETYNAAIQLESSSDSVQLYKKSILVPGAESFPYHKYMWFFKPLVDHLGGTASGNGKQKERSTFHSDNGVVAPVICYEAIYGEYTTGYIKKGAQAIFIGTNDGWWDDTAGRKQHLAFARLRAIETRRPIARAANTGISAFINQRGDVTQAGPIEEEATLKGAILFNDQITFYTIWGDLIARIAIFVSILLLLNAFVKGRLKSTT